MAEFEEEEIEWDLSPLEPPKPRLREQYWKQTRRWHAREYAKYGKASGVDPAIIWPTKEELKTLIEEEREYFPSLQQMQAEIEMERKAAELERMKREKIIEANMARMPKMIEDYRNKKRQEREKQKQQKAKRERLLAQAKEKLGYAIDPRSPRFKQMVEEMEAEEKKRRKELKRKGISV